MNTDLLIYPVHGAYWSSFGIAGWLMERHLRRQPAVASTAAPAAASETTAPYSRSVLALHAFAFGVMYFGLANAVIPDRVAHWFPGQQIAGTLLIALGAGLITW